MRRVLWRRGRQERGIAGGRLRESWVYGGKIELERPRVRARDGGEMALPS